VTSQITRGTVGHIDWGFSAPTTHTRLTALNIMYSKYASIIFKTRNWSKIMMITTYTGKRIIARPDYSGLQSPEPQRHSTILAKMQKKIEKKHYEIACYSQTVIILFACLLFISVHFFNFDHIAYSNIYISTSTALILCLTKIRIEYLISLTRHCLCLSVFELWV